MVSSISTAKSFAGPEGITMSRSDQIASLERRIQDLESQQITTSRRRLADAVSMQAFLQGAIAAGAAGRAEASTIAREGAGAAWASLFACEALLPITNAGETAVRAFWWGFHLQLSHTDLSSLLDSADMLNDVVAAVGGNIPNPAQPWIKLLAPFISATHEALRGLDRGRGIYISMSWVTPGIFIPTSA